MNARLTTLILLALALVLPGVQAAQAPVARAQFASGVDNREPVDLLARETEMRAKLYFFTELHGLAGQRVVHEWHHAGTPIAEVTLDVGTDRWRTWSSKTIWPEMNGDWTVRVLDQGGQVLYEETLRLGD